MSLFPHQRSHVLALALGAAVLATATPLAAGASTHATTASIIASAKSSMLQKVSVHIVVESKSSLRQSKVVVDIGRKSGQETITSGNKNVTITITPKYAYLSGNANGLKQIMGFTSVQQQKIGTKAMAMKFGTAQYTNLSANLTTPVFASMLPAEKGTTLTTTGSGSSKQYVLSWHSAPSTSTASTSTVMTFTTGSSTLPLTEKITSAKGFGLTTYSKWGESVTPKAPTSTVSYKSVFG